MENFLSEAGGEQKAVRVFCAIMKGVKWSFFPLWRQKCVCCATTVKCIQTFLFNVDRASFFVCLFMCSGF